MATRSELEAAYRAAIYRIDLPDGPLDLRIGQAAPRLAAWLAEKRCDGFVVITAYNPASVMQPLAVNAAQQQKLLQRVRKLGCPLLTGCNHAPGGEWPDEPSVLAGGLAGPTVAVLGRQFGQNAVIVGAADGVPQLLWIQEER